MREHSHAGGRDAGASLAAFPRWSVGTIIEKTTIEPNSAKTKGDLASAKLTKSPFFVQFMQRVANWHHLPCGHPQGVPLQNRPLSGILRQGDGANRLPLNYLPQHFLNFRPLPQLQGSLRPILGALRTTGFRVTLLPSVKSQPVFSFLKRASSWCTFASPFSL